VAPLFRRILVRIAVGAGFVALGTGWLERGEHVVVGYGLLACGIPLLAVGAYQAGWEIRRRPSAVALSAFALLGVVASLVADRPWASMNSAQTARALEHRLSSMPSARALGLSHPITDRYVCSHTGRVASPGAPAWTYLCVDAVHSRESDFFVLTRGAGIAKIQSAG
jgi:hypothetical protein